MDVEGLRGRKRTHRRAPLRLGERAHRAQRGAPSARTRPARPASRGGFARRCAPPRRPSSCCPPAGSGRVPTDATTLTHERRDEGPDEPGERRRTGRREVRPDGAHACVPRNGQRLGPGPLDHGPLAEREAHATRRHPEPRGNESALQRNLRLRHHVPDRLARPGGGRRPARVRDDELVERLDGPPPRAARRSRRARSRSRRTSARRRRAPRRLAEALVHDLRERLLAAGVEVVGAGRDRRPDRLRSELEERSRRRCDAKAPSKASISAASSRASATRISSPARASCRARRAAAPRAATAARAREPARRRAGQCTPSRRGPRAGVHRSRHEDTRMGVSAKRVRVRVLSTDGGVLIAEGEGAIDPPEVWKADHLLSRRSRAAQCRACATTQNAPASTCSERGDGRASSRSARTTDATPSSRSSRPTRSSSSRTRATSQRLNRLKAERDCFVGASLTVEPEYRWRVNGRAVSARAAPS